MKLSVSSFYVAGAQTQALILAVFILEELLSILIFSFWIEKCFEGKNTFEFLAYPLLQKFIWKSKLETKGKTKTDWFLVLWFIPHMAVVAGVGLGQNQEPKTLSGYPMWVLGPKRLGYVLLLSQMHEQGAGSEA